MTNRQRRCGICAALRSGLGCWGYKIAPNGHLEDVGPRLDTTSSDTHQECFSQHVQRPAACCTRLRLPLLQPFCYRGQVNESVVPFATHKRIFSRRLVNSNDLDALVCKCLLQSATEIRRLAKSADEDQMLVMALA